MEQRARHPYYMHDAILAQPERVAAVLEESREAIARAAEAAASRQRLIFTGIGTSLHAAQVAGYFLRLLSAGGIRAEIEHSFELLHYPPRLDAQDAVIGISHGGKNFTADALALARRAGAATVGVASREASEDLSDVEFAIPTCEQEISNAHTKSYTTALAALAALAIGIAERRGVLADGGASTALTELPARLRDALGCEAVARAAARDLARRNRWLLIGSGPNWPTASEGALKAKEACYIAAEGFETEQFLHGPLAEADARAALVVIFAGGPGDARAVQALRAAGELGVLRVIVAARGAAPGAPAEHRIEVPAVAEWISPIVQVVPLQFFAYYAALERRANPDTGREDQPGHARARVHYKV